MNIGRTSDSSGLASSDPRVSEGHIPKPAPSSVPFLDGIVKAVTSIDFKFGLPAGSFGPEDIAIIKKFPALFDVNGGAKRKLSRLRQAG